MNLDTLTSHEISQADRDTSPILIPLGTLEQHGPHLPAGTKTLLAEGIAFEAAQLLKKEGLTPLIGPSFPYAPCRLSYGFPSNFGISPRTFSDFLFEIGQSFHFEGFRWLFFVNPMISPEVLKAVQTATDDLSSIEGFSAFDPLPLWRFNERPETEQLLTEHGINISADIHGGAVETSMIRYLDAPLVKPVAGSLPRHESNLSWENLKGNFSLLDMGSTDGYLGNPAVGSSPLGETYLAQAGLALSQAISFAMAGNEMPLLPLQIRMVLKLVDLDEI